MSEYKRIIKLLCVTSQNNNKFYEMHDLGNGTMRCEYGRVDLTRAKKEYPISRWDSIYRSKTKKGYKDMTELSVIEVNENTSEVTSVAIQDDEVKMFFEKLNGYSKQSIERNYKVSSSSVTQAMIDEAQRIIELLYNKSRKIGPACDLDEMNDLLIDLFHVIPRKMRHVTDHLFEKFDTSLNENVELIADEQATLDVLSNDVKMLAKQKDKQKLPIDKQEENILDTLGLKIVTCTNQEKAAIKKLMGSNAWQFKSAFKVINDKSQDDFDLNLKDAKNKYTLEMFHGSRNENWLNIMNTGLLIRPTGAVHTGSMFGDGIYGADDADKSIGYCSLKNSRWAHGSEGEAILGIFDFHLGKQYHTANSDSSLSKNKLKKMGNYDSTFGHKGGGKYGGWLRKNEFIVYNKKQVTIKYLIKIKN